jgi:DeoR family fructose operon transcriptional repressor
MFAEERLHAITMIVRKSRRLTFAELQRHIRASPATLRRDLTELEKSGAVIRVHGGILDPAYVRSEASFEERMVKNQSAKTEIGVTANALIPRGATVLIDSGSTCLAAGKLLVARDDVRIVTNSVALLAAALQGNADILCLGGQMRRVSGALTGSAAIGALGLINADIALIGASGIEPDAGCSTTELSEAEMKRDMLNRASRRVLLADATKWHKPSTVRFASWTDFDDWIVDRAPPKSELKSLREAQVRVHEATSSKAR